VLFFLYFARYTGEPDDQAFAEAALTDLFEGLPEAVPFTFCSGITGIAWLLRHASASGLVDVEANEPLAEIDGCLRARMVEEMQAGRFDYLHGALGCALYFLEAAHEPRNCEALIATLDALEQHAVRAAGGCCWHNPLLEQSAETRGEVSLGLSHGMPSIISLLQRFVGCGLDPARAARLRDGALAYLQAQAGTGTGEGRYPGIVTPSGPGRSRLAWCYGDPGVAMALSQAGLSAEAASILDDASGRRTADDTGVADLSLCHGSAGLSLIFARARGFTSRSAIADAARFWLDDTLARVPATEDLTLLNGIAGAGLALIAASDERAPAWDRALLLS
jgi:lantibiotic modifying enzyme